MASLMTPSRSQRGLLVPNLVTKPAPDDIATALAYGLHTPPQSAHESRRPSLQQIWVEPSFQRASSVVGYSQPTTPVHRVDHGHDTLFQDWSNGHCASSSNAERPLETHFTPSSFRHDVISIPPSQSFLPCGGLAQYSTTEPFTANFHATNAYSETWHQPLDSTRSPSSQTSCLELDSLRLKMSLAADIEMSGHLHHISDIGLQGSNASYNPRSILPPAQQSFLESASYHHSQVIVPSQLGPTELYYQSQGSEYASPDSSSDGIFSGITPSPPITFGSFEAIQAPSPMEAALDHVERDNCLNVMSIEEHKLPGSHRRLPFRNAAAVRKNPPRRGQAKTETWYSHKIAGIKVSCKGTQFSLTDPPKHSIIKKDKHGCEYLDLDGTECSRQFDRKEHLTRHNLVHTGEKPWICPCEPCGIPCTYKSARSDNACDHFKTHLRPREKFRNKPVTWPDLESAILEAYSPKMAEQVLRNIRKWLDKGMPEKMTARAREFAGFGDIKDFSSTMCNDSDSD